MNNPDKDWERWGKEDPYFGVVSLDRFHAEKITAESLEEFFDSGRRHIDYLLATIRGHMDPEFRPRKALDFGCGVGRCTIPLARVCQSVTGVDVSESMLKEGRKNAEAQGVANIEWRQSGDLGGVMGPFDFVHSFIVFQHIPPARGLVLLSRLIDLLSPNGIASVQFLYHKDTPVFKRVMGRLRTSVPLLHNLTNLLYGKPFGAPLMQKNAYNLNRALNLMHRKGCGNCHLRFEGTDALQGVVVFFQKRPDAVPYDAFYG